MIAIRVCPICKRKFECAVGNLQVYCNECAIMSEYATLDKVAIEAPWFFDDADSDEQDLYENKKESKNENKENLVKKPLPEQPRQDRDSLLLLINNKNG